MEVMPDAPNALRIEEMKALLSNLSGDYDGERYELERALQSTREEPPQSDPRAYQQWGFSLARRLYEYHLREENLDLAAARQALEMMVSRFTAGMPIGCHAGTLLRPLLERQQQLAERELADENEDAAVARLRASAAVEWYAAFSSGEQPNLRRIRPLLRLEQIFAPPEPVRLIAFGSNWRYSASGKSPTGDWTGNDFEDTNWQSGRGMLGFLSEQRTLLPRNLPGSKQSLKSYYFRHLFTPPPDVVVSGTDRLILRVKRDDGIVIYLNGKEIAADNMPPGAVTFETLAIRDNGDHAAGEIIEFELPADVLVAGGNTIAAEVHQWATASSDMHFDLELLVGPGLRLARILTDSTTRISNRPLQTRSRCCQQA